MKRLLPIILVLTIFISTFTVQTQKAYANPLAAGLIGGGAYAGAGVYVIGGLLVAGGLAAVGADEYGDEINAHAQKVWDATDQHVKEGFKVAFDSSVAAGKGTMTVTTEFIDSLKANSSIISNYIWEKLNAHEYEQSGAPVIGYSGSSDYKYINYNRVPNVRFATAGGIATFLQASVYYSEQRIKIEALLLNGDYSTSFYSYKDDQKAWDAWNASTDLATFNDFLRTVGAGAANPYIANPTVPSISAMNDRINNLVDSLAGVKEVAIPLDEFIAKGKTGENLSYNPEADAWAYPNGNVAQPGEITWDVPTPGIVGDVPIPGLDNPSLPLDKVGTGDLPLTQPTTGNPPIDGDLSLLDFLKKILNAILDVLNGIWTWIKDILATLGQMLANLAEMLGILAIAQTIADVLTNIWDWIRNRPPPAEPGTPGSPTSPLPLAILLALFDLLISVIFYLVRMLEFVLKIPVIPAKPIDNPAFAWFREAKIMGVYIYQVVSSMGTIGLSFLVFKAIRKVMP